LELSLEVVALGSLSSDVLNKILESGLEIFSNSTVRVVKL
jgi:hypothetical protein